MSAIGLVEDPQLLPARRLPATVGLGALVVVVIVVALVSLRSTLAPRPATATIQPAEQSGWQAIPLSAQLAISRAVGADQPRYQLHGAVARIPEQGLSSRFSPSGVTVSTVRGSLHLGLRGRTVAPQLHGSRVLYRRGAVTEWYANGPLGLEQGFTLSRGASGVLVLAAPGRLRPRVLPGGAGLLWRDGRGRAVLREQGLSAWDALGHRLGVRFVRSAGRGLAIRVDTAGARYPVTVDPIVQEAQLTASDGYAGEGTGADFANGGISAGGLGASVAIDGSTIAVGAPGAAVSYGPGLSSTYPDGQSDSHQGAVYVFTEPSTGWADATETAKLFASDGVGAGTQVSSSSTNVYGDALGSSVAISGDTIVAAAPRASAGGQIYAGKLYVFSAPSNGWTTAFQTAELAASDATTDDLLGSSLAFDGQTVVAGVPNRNNSNYPGAVYVFAKPASGGWVNSAQQANEIADPASSDSDDFGAAVAISGSTIAAGAPYANGYTGAVYTFTRPGAAWSGTLTSQHLLAATPVSDETMGASVAIDGGTLVAGGPHLASNGGPRPSGAAYVFTNSGSWSTAPQARLTPSDGGSDDGFGTFVAVSGTSVSVTGYPGGTPTLYGFSEPSGGWSSGTQSSEDTLNGAAAHFSSGSVALQSGTIVAGVPSANAGSTPGAGAALVLTTGTLTTPAGGSTTTTSETPAPTSSNPAPAPSPPAAQSPAPAGPTLTYTSQPVFTDTTTAADIIAGLFGIRPGSGQTENLGQFTFVAYCNKPQGQCAAGTSFGQQLGTNTAAHIRLAHAAKRSKAVIWGSGRISIKAKKHATVVVKLDALGRRLLARARVLKGQLRITVSGTSRIHAFTLRYKPKVKAKPKLKATRSTRRAEP